MKPLSLKEALRQAQATKEGGMGFEFKAPDYGSLSHDLARQEEAVIRTQLFELRTHRLNVYIEKSELKFYQDVNGNWFVSQECRLRLLLPRGPRPLP